MLTHALQEHDIDAQIEGQEANKNLAQPLAIWVPEEQSAEAKELISNIEASPLEPEAEVSRDADQTDGKSVGSTPSSSRFFAGLLLGAVLGYGYFAYQDRTVSKEEIPGNTDRNGDGIQDVWIKHSLTDNEPIVLSDSDYDGSPDEWFHYENGVLVRAEYDRNKDEKPDSWRYYNDMEQLARAEDDDDFNGEPDYWIEYENGAAHEFTTDNDFDGRGDEWGTFENGFVKKRSISFRKSGVADKRILYEHNRREEVRILNAFEEVTNITPKSTRITDVW